MFEVEPYNDDVTLVKTATAMEDGQPIMWAIAYLIKDTLFQLFSGGGVAAVCPELRTRRLVSMEAV